MSSYKPPYTITSKMVNLISAISEEITRVEYNKKEIITPQLRKKNRVKTLAECHFIPLARSFCSNANREYCKRKSREIL